MGSTVATGVEVESTTEERRGGGVVRLGTRSNEMHCIFEEVSGIQLRYGVNPHQVFARAEPIGDRSPIKLVSGTPSYVNVLDALNAWQLVRDAGLLLGKPAADVVQARLAGGCRRGRATRRGDPWLLRAAGSRGDPVNGFTSFGYATSDSKERKHGPCGRI